MNKSTLAVETYRIDQAHSTITFKVKHLMINYNLGRFNKFEGAVHFDPHDLADSGIRIIIQVASIDTYNRDRDNHLMDGEFFDINQYPTIAFMSKSISRHLGRYFINGDLTIKGHTKQISLPVHIEGPVKGMQGEEVIGITGEMTINRKDFGISFDKATENGKPVVDDHVKIEINLEAKK
jgi:polyisoprenoid-binding protein YceI